jgi:RNase P/RNase MRP subunit POP5
MKALKPSVREKKRYLLVEGENLEKKLPKAVKEYVGDLGLSKASIYIIKKAKKYCVISINRESLNDVRAAIVLYLKNSKVIRVSGSIKGLGIKNR